MAIPLLVQTHRAHDEVTSWWAHRDVALSGHAVVETYSVLTRLPGDLRLSPLDAAHLIRTRFAEPLVLAPATARDLPTLLAGLGIAGGAVYDAIVGLAARDGGHLLATRDARAKSTYDAVGVRTIVV